MAGTSVGGITLSGYNWQGFVSPCVCSDVSLSWYLLTSSCNLETLGYTKTVDMKLPE